MRQWFVLLLCLASTICAGRPTYEEALAEIGCVLRESRTPDDIRLLAMLRATASGHTGTFVEIGAYDGVDSQTRVLETCYGWSGVLIEANPEHYKWLLRANRSSATKRVFSAVCQPPPNTTTGTVTMRLAGGTISSVVGLAYAHDRRYGVHFRRNSSTAQVPCSTLPHIMANNGLSSGATFLSLDVEGAEKYVLETVPLVNFPFDAVLVEADGLSREKDQQVDKMLQNAGLLQLEHPVTPHSINHLFSRQLWNFTPAHDVAVQAVLAQKLAQVDFPLSIQLSGILGLRNNSLTGHDTDKAGKQLARKLLEGLPEAVDAFLNQKEE
jgi:FkbM family methyltransferase